MPTPGIIEPFNVVKHIGSGVIPGDVMSPTGALGLHGREEALNRCVVPAVAFPAHAALDPLVCQQSLEVLAGVLATPVGVMRAWVLPLEVGLRLATPLGLCVSG